MFKMTVKEDKKVRKIPWKGIIIGGVVVAVIYAITSLFLVSMKNNKDNAKKYEAKRALEFKNKLNDLVSKKYDVVCKDKIINKDTYMVIKVKGTFRIIIGENTKELEDTYKMSQCNVIYNVTKEIQ